MAFEKLERIIELDIEYKAKSALAISIGRQPGEIVEMPVIKLAGLPVIPGSSLKGALRSTLESMLAQMGVEVCVPMAAIPRRQRNEPERTPYLQKIDRLAPCEDIEEPCPVCTIFGISGARAGLAGRAITLDATTEPGKFDLIERTHVAIARDTKSQAEGSLMSLEAVDSGAVFSGGIRFVNPEDWQVGAVVRALEALQYLGMGGKKTAGYGDLDITIKASRVIHFEDGEWKSEPINLEPYQSAFATKFGARK